MEATIREARLEDFDAVFELLLGLREHFGDSMALKREGVLSIFRRFLASDDHCVYVAESGGRPIGLMTISILFSLYEDRPYAVIDELIVVADHRGRGIGKRFLDEAFARAVERGCCAVCLDTTPGNEGALRFYREYGFDRESVLLEKELE